MNVETFVAILTVPILVIKLTLAHLAKVVFVQIITLIPLLAKALQPMFTNVIVVVPSIVVGLRILGWRRVPPGTPSTKRAVS